MQATIHLWVGSITLLLFLVTTILYALGISGRAIPAAKYVSYLASLFLLLQYLLGIGLLFSGNRNKAIHYLFALLVIIPVGLEHGMIRKRFSGREQAVNLTLAAGAATVLVLITWLIGKMNG